jgi:hypothetical protein
MTARHGIRAGLMGQLNLLMREVLRLSALLTRRQTVCFTEKGGPSRWSHP